MLLGGRRGRGREEEERGRGGGGEGKGEKVHKVFIFITDFCKRKIFRRIWFCCSWIILAILAISILVAIVLLHQEYQCKTITNGAVVYSGDITKAGVLTPCLSNAALTSSVDLTSIRAFSVDCGNILTYQEHVNRNQEFYLTDDDKTFTIYDNRVEKSSYFANGIKSRTMINITTETNATLLTCAFADYSKFKKFINQYEKLQSPSDCSIFNASNGQSTYKYLYNNSESSYFFIGVRITAGNINYFSFNFSANRDYYNVSDYLQQHMCQIFDTSNCNLEVPFSQTCVMLNAVFDPDNDLSQFFKLTLVGTKQRLMLIFVVVLSFMALLVLITFIILPGFICKFCIRN